LIIKGLPQLAGSIGIFAVAAVVMALVAAMIWAVISHKQLLSIIFTSFVLIVIGYSTYTMVFIRSNQNPSIDVGEPNTTQSAIAYLEREQYGRVYQLPRKYDGFWTGVFFITESNLSVL
jgi:apolipoprotein N-acyltransferase